jgi:hypothetical protein
MSHRGSTSKRIVFERMTEVAFPMNVRVTSLKRRLEHTVCYFTYSQWCIGAPSQRFPELKDKAVALQAWSDPEGSRKLRFPDFMTASQDGDKVVSLTHRPPLPPGNTPGAHFC